MKEQKLAPAENWDSRGLVLVSMGLQQYLGWKLEWRPLHQHGSLYLLSGVCSRVYQLHNTNSRDRVYFYDLRLGYREKSELANFLFIV